MKSSLRMPIVYKSISELMLGLGMSGPRHPTVALVNYDVDKINVINAGQSFLLDFYKISFKKKFKGQVKYGQGHYEFEEGGLAFVKPNQLVTMQDDTASYEGYTLYFHTDLLRSYQLGKNIRQYGFFSYAVNEALLLSDKEKGIVAAIFDSIAAELSGDTDAFSQDVIVSQIELLLNYSNRFYNRQFQTRKHVHNELIDQMESYLAERFVKPGLVSGLPTVQEVSDYLSVSPRYLNDMLRTLSGKNTQQHIHDRLIERAKMMLCSSQMNIAEIAYQLGFEHPQSFNRLFKQSTMMSPNAFRKS